MGANGDNGSQGTPKQKGKGPREKAIPLSPNGHTARFLYLMLKQINIKQIDWQEVAEGTGISKASSAKLRYSRFKRQIESQLQGDAIQLKKEQSKEDEEKSVDFGLNTSLKRDLDEDGAADADVKKRIKLENGTPVKREYQRSSAVFSIDDDDDDEVNETISSSPTQTPFVKSEFGTAYDPFGSSYRRKPSNITSSFKGPVSGYPHNPVIKTEGSTSCSPANKIRPSISTTPSQQPGNYRSPWAASESEEDQGAPSTSSTNTHGNRKNSHKTGKGSAQEPFSID